MGIIKEFKEFAMRGNVIDMAVGIIIGAAFGKIVSSLVGDVIMPPVGKLLGGVDFKDKFINLSSDKGPFNSLAEAKTAGAATLNYGVFINEVINFLIVALAVFMLIKAINTARNRFERQKEAAPPPPPTLDQQLLMDIRDTLKAKK
ncbi:MAG TPA: large conductance mechanosensitive channel protein MscL [Phycisphaerales bacterium]|nr:large conductance mechanosensitive channel protein MscL [Phycisphaerales bacterium]